MSAPAGATGLWLVGCGNMGGALLRRWLAAGVGPVTVIDPGPTGLPAGVTARADCPDGVPETLVLAVKPQAWRDIVDGWPARDWAGVRVVSVMAGVRLAALAAAFPGADVVRAMPNTPAAIGAGVTGLHGFAGEDAEVSALFAPAGATVWLDQEADFDAVTALSGSGPAYVFALIEALAAAGENAGLSADVAMTLARATVIGAGALAASDPAPVATLRERVTSPAGTTAAGLAVLRPGLGPLLTETVAAAAARSRELAG